MAVRCATLGSQTPIHGYQINLIPTLVLTLTLTPTLRLIPRPRRAGVQSNHCRATAAAARLVGLEPHLVLVLRDREIDTEVNPNPNPNPKP